MNATTITFNYPNAVLRKAALAEHVGCCLRQIDKLVAQGGLPRPGHLGTTPYWMLHDVDSFLTEQMRQQNNADPEPEKASKKKQAKADKQHKAGAFSV